MTGRCQVEQPELAAVRARIRALREMTAERGCTEYEALAAATKAAELMARHQLDEAALAQPSMVRLRFERAATRLRLPWTMVWNAIAEVCALRCWIEGRTLVYFGHEPDILVADYLHELLERSADAARQDFLRSAEYRRRRKTKTRRLAVEAFLDGFLGRLSVRLVQAFNGEAAGGQAARARRIERRRRVEAEVERQGMSFVARQGRHKRLDRHDAFGVGRAAAAGVEIKAGVGSGVGATPLIGR